MRTIPIEHIVPVDVGVITIIEDEFAAVLTKLGPGTSYSPGRRRYKIFDVPDNGGGIYRVAVARCYDQGNSQAQSLATAMLADVNPMFILIVGIGGGVPSSDFSLGDVIISTHIYDYSRGALHSNRDTDYSQRGGTVAADAISLATFLRAEEDQLGTWYNFESIGMQKPSVDLSDETKFYGPKKWIDKVTASLHTAFGPSAISRAPLFKDGPIESSNFLVKDAETLEKWMQGSRDALAIDMESAGVYAAMHNSNEPVPFLTIRGLSDIVGYNRDDRWKKYACNSAASFAIALIRSGLLPRRARTMPVATNSPNLVNGSPQLMPPTDHIIIEANDASFNTVEGLEDDQILAALGPLSDITDNLKYDRPPWSYWYYAGYLTYGRPWASNPWKHIDALSKKARLDLYIGQGIAAFGNSDFGTAAEMASLGLVLSNEMSDKWLKCFAQFSLGTSNTFLSATDTSSLLARSAAEAIAQKDAWLIAFGNVCIGTYFWSRSMHHVAAKHFHFSNARFRILRRPFVPMYGKE